MVSLGNICDIAAGYGSVGECSMYCGILRVFLRKLGRVRKRPFGSLTSPTFVCARARSKPTSSKLKPLFATTREVHFVDFWPHTGLMRAFQHLMRQKPCGFASFRRCQLAGEGCGAVLWEYGWCWGCGWGLGVGLCEFVWCRVVVWVCTIVRNFGLG